MSLRTPLHRVRGLGSAKEGTQHWWAQRLTAIALVPLTVWFIYSLVVMTTMEYATVTAWMQSPIVSTLLILFIFSLFYHAQLGMQVVIEDYVDSETLKFGSIILLNFVMLFAGLASVIAVLKVFLGL
ncbi:MAG: succinate dehydrogenase, hydrophobic membrane anchor protein [Gammaproteobacteria bacterium]|nr:succinate dehydrogenase, hydrophobic membrane anchor protein [Gammaproteobacteria bacterium]